MQEGLSSLLDTESFIWCPLTEMVGLSLSYGMALNSCLFFMTWAMGTIEQNMIAVERIQQYTSLSSEGPFLIKDQRPTNGWPLRGELVVQGLKVGFPKLNSFRRNQIQ